MYVFHAALAIAACDLRQRSWTAKAERKHELAWRLDFASGVVAKLTTAPVEEIEERYKGFARTDGKDLKLRRLHGIIAGVLGGYLGELLTTTD